MGNGTLDIVESIKGDYVQADIALILEKTGEDASEDAGRILNAYLGFSENKQMMMFGSPEFLIRRMAEKYGSKRDYFQQMWKLPIAIHELWKRGDKEQLGELKDYSLELMGE